MVRWSVREAGCQCISWWICIAAVRDDRSVGWCCVLSMCVQSSSSVEKPTRSIYADEHRPTDRQTSTKEHRTTRMHHNTLATKALLWGAGYKRCRRSIRPVDGYGDLPRKSYKICASNGAIWDQLSYLRLRNWATFGKFCRKLLARRKLGPTAFPSVHALGDL